MAPLLHPHPSLVALYLVIETRDGPRFVFHYPPEPKDTPPPVSSTAYEGSIADDIEEESWGPDEDETYARSSLGASGSLDGRKRSAGRVGSEDLTQSPSHEAAWERVCGLSTAALESVLIPHRSFKKRKFELSLEPLTYLSYPVFVREDGSWKKRSKKARKKPKHSTRQQAPEESRGLDRAVLSSTEDGEPAPYGGARSDSEGDDTAIEGKTADLDLDAIEDDSDRKSVATDEDCKAMTVFNMVFVMNPPLLEHNLRIANMYENVAKKFAKALKFEQARTNWLWRESDLILSIKEKGKETGTPMPFLWTEILSKSSLAKAMSEVFLSISASKIAHVFIGDSFDVSLQIPQPDSISRLPTIKDPQMPGLWLTTANIFDEDEDLDEKELAKQFGLLLLDDVDNILRDIDTENGPPELSSPLVEFVRIVKPTMSFAHIHTQYNLSLNQIQALSRHLIYWRRARAIPPLHQRYQYIVSPNCDMSSLPEARTAYAARFPSLPALHKMLALLSGNPRAYSTLIPSKDHRAAYLDILAWLMRGGWITQLRTFAWVSVPCDIKQQVAQEMAREEHEKTSPNATNSNTTTTTTTTTSSSSSSHTATKATSPMSAKSGNIIKRGRQTSIPAAAATAAVNPGPADRDIPTHSSEVPQNTTTKINGSEQSAPSIILEPHKANHVESRWLDAIGASFADPDVRTAWRRFIRYFNGRHALEKIPMREGIKHKDVWRWLAAMEADGVLLTLKHW
ncbi:MAG: hypothetical protein M1825_003543 [Sarcosagium campestre]|nr:MAG: hypothetical protein M1825_003543 [Sarcosagium campestre]